MLYQHTTTDRRVRVALQIISELLKIIELKLHIAAILAVHTH